MKHMKLWLKSFSVIGLIGTLTTSVISCVDDGSQTAMPLSVAKALNLVDPVSSNPLITLKHTSSTSWAVDLSSLTLGNLLQGTNDSELAKDGCDTFIKNILNINSDTSNYFNRSKLTSLNNFTEVDNVTPFFAFNKDSNKYFLLGGFFSIQFKKDAKHKLGDEYFIPLKTDLSFELDKI